MLDEVMYRELVRHAKQKISSKVNGDNIESEDKKSHANANVNKPMTIQIIFNTLSGYVRTYYIAFKCKFKHVEKYPFPIIGFHPANQGIYTVVQLEKWYEVIDQCHRLSNHRSQFETSSDIIKVSSYINNMEDEKQNVPCTYFDLSCIAWLQGHLYARKRTSCNLPYIETKFGEAYKLHLPFQFTSFTSYITFKGSVIQNIDMSPSFHQIQPVSVSTEFKKSTSLLASHAPVEHKLDKPIPITGKRKLFSVYSTSQSIHMPTLKRPKMNELDLHNVNLKKILYILRRQPTGEHLFTSSSSKWNLSPSSTLNSFKEHIVYQF